MSHRIFNFAAGPCTLPLPVLEKAQAEFVEYQGSGMSLFEMSHRGKYYDKVQRDALALFRSTLNVPETHEILFLQGGATLQFGMVPLNFLHAGKTAEFVNTGIWAKKALADAKVVGNTKVIWTGEETKFDRAPDMKDVTVSPDAAYVHLTTNETIGGVEYTDLPNTNVPIVADMSSHIMSRPIDVSKFALIYAGAQKNLGPAGLTVVVIRKDFMEQGRADLPVYLRYSTHAGEAISMYNTPPVFAIYMMKNVLEWVNEVGGLAEMNRRADIRSKLIYDVIEASDGYYRCPVQKGSRSRMNVPFRLPTEELEKKFLAEVDAAGFSGLKGHRSVGGCRASMYNAMPIEGAEGLAKFMTEFKKKN